MKPYCLFVFGLFFQSLITSCNDDVASNSQDEGYQEIALTEQVCTPSMENRETVDTFNEERGEIQVIEYSDGSQMVIAPERKSEHMSTNIIQICNMPVPTKLQSFGHGDLVIFSGELKEVFPTENMPGNPFKLTSIKIKLTEERIE